MTRPDVSRIHALADASQVAPPTDAHLLAGIIRRSAATRVFFSRARRYVLELVAWIRHLEGELALERERTRRAESLNAGGPF